MNIAKTLIIVGLILLFLGVFIYLFKPYLGWFGNLFGDISYKTDKFSFYMPITSMIILSAIATLILNLFFKFFEGK